MTDKPTVIYVKDRKGPPGCRLAVLCLCAGLLLTGLCTLPAILAGLAG